MSGFISAVLVLCSIGFVILLVIFFRGGLPEIGAGSAAEVPTAAGLVPAPAVVPPPAPSGNAAPRIRPVSADDHLRGDPQAAVKVVEYSDLECPFCKRFHPTMQQVVAQYQGRVAWVYRHFPLDSLHPKADKEAEATECAGELGGNDKFWAYVDRLFEVTPSNNGLDPAQLSQIAVGIGFDRTEFQSCLDSGRHAVRVQADYEDAVSAGGQGTPYSVVVGPNGQTYPIAGALPFPAVQSIIDQALAAR